MSSDFFRPFSEDGESLIIILRCNRDPILRELDGLEVSSELELREDLCLLVVFSLDFGGVESRVKILVGEMVRLILVSWTIGIDFGFSTHFFSTRKPFGLFERSFLESFFDFSLTGELDRFLRGDFERFFGDFLEDRLFDGVRLLDRVFRFDSFFDFDFFRLSDLSFESDRRELLFNGLRFTISGGESDLPSELRPRLLLRSRLRLRSRLLLRPRLLSRDFSFDFTLFCGLSLLDCRVFGLDFLGE